MALDQLESKSHVSLSDPLPQFVPGSVCAQCDVCCRFPESDSFLRPYFTRDEIGAAVAQGLSPALFTDPVGSQIALVKDAESEGYLCPAFDPATSRCGIYAYRPLDCQLYPLALMWSADGSQIELGWDTKCPFMREAVPGEIHRHAGLVHALLQRETTLRLLANNPRLIGRFQEDVIVLASLPELTDRLRLHQPDPRLRPLRLEDAPRMKQALERSECPGHEALAAYAFVYHYIWTTTLSYWWMERDGVFFLFAHSPGGWFMPLPPLGPRLLEESVGEGLADLHRWNHGSPVSRIENVTDHQKACLAGSHLQWSDKSPDYLYRADSLAQLAGDSYKSQRALCNRVERTASVTLRPYTVTDQPACRDLFRRWVSQKREGTLDTMGQFLLEDAEAAHELIWALGDRLGLAGTVACAEDQVVGYTFGYWLTPETFAVLVEVADRSVPGLAQYLFRETCRAARHGGAEYINAMDDAGLPGLSAAKQAYHPVATIKSWIASPLQP
ncbi:MAG: phosphatidylglycerol lysyltransferase domain-containing protein [Nitrospirota bacterium]|jgi:Fe-S-cluster containining protein